MSKTIAVMAIDPGKNGGLVAITEDSVIECSRCPKSVEEMASMVNHVVSECYVESYDLITYIENVHAFPTDGRSSAFKFGVNFGTWLGILGSNHIVPIKVSPITWQKQFQPLSKIKKERKKMLYDLAKDMFPSLKITYAISDALLMGAYGMSNGK